MKDTSGASTGLQDAVLPPTKQQSHHHTVTARGREVLPPNEEADQGSAAGQGARPTKSVLQALLRSADA
jgi:hypothetical protein